MSGGDDGGSGQQRSMADILASIRRMVTEEPAAGLGPPGDGFRDSPGNGRADSSGEGAGDSPPPSLAETADAFEQAFAPSPREAHSAESPVVLPLSVEDLVRQALEPVLRQWLDDNLHDIVERVVRQEVRRVSGRD